MTRRSAHRYDELFIHAVCGGDFCGLPVRSGSSGDEG